MYIALAGTVAGAAWFTAIQRRKPRPQTADARVSASPPAA